MDQDTVLKIVALLVALAVPIAAILQGGAALLKARATLTTAHADKIEAETELIKVQSSSAAISNIERQVVVDTVSDLRTELRDRNEDTIRSRAELAKMVKQVNTQVGQLNKQSTIIIHKLDIADPNMTTEQVDTANAENVAEDIAAAANSTPTPGGERSM